MRVLIQRVSSASILANKEDRGSIEQGLLILLGIEESDTAEDTSWLAQKISKLRIFADDNGVMNLSINDIDGEIALVSQFTLHASTKKGSRPSYIKAAKPETAIPIYEHFVEELRSLVKKPLITGVFGADMQISLVNDGPVTLFIDSKNRE